MNHKLLYSVLVSVLVLSLVLFLFRNGVLNDDIQNSVPEANPNPEFVIPQSNNNSQENLTPQDIEVDVWVSTVGFSPNVIKVPVGATLFMNVFSSDVEHGVYFPEPERVILVVTPDNPGGIKLTFNEPGEYKFWDDRVQHEITNERLEGVVIVS